VLFVVFANNNNKNTSGENYCSVLNI